MPRDRRAATPSRVYITGPPGSGKTILAARLGRRLGLETYELDSGAAALDRFDLDHRWVVEGAFVWNVEPFLRAADLIVWLDVPMRHTLHRIVRRHIRLSLLGRNHHRGIRLLVRFLCSQPHYFRSAARAPSGPTDWDAISRANHAVMLGPFRSKVVRLRSPRATRRWVRGLC